MVYQCPVHQGAPGPVTGTGGMFQALVKPAPIVWSSLTGLSALQPGCYIRTRQLLGSAEVRSPVGRQVGRESKSLAPQSVLEIIESNRKKK